MPIRGGNQRVVSIAADTSPVKPALIRFCAPRTKAALPQTSPAPPDTETEHRSPPRSANRRHAAIGFNKTRWHATHTLVITATGFPALRLPPETAQRIASASHANREVSAGGTAPARCRSAPAVSQRQPAWPIKQRPTSTCRIYLDHYSSGSIQRHATTRPSPPAPPRPGAALMICMLSALALRFPCPDIRVIGTLTNHCRIQHQPASQFLQRPPASPRNWYLQRPTVNYRSPMTIQAVLSFLRHISQPFTAGNHHAGDRQPQRRRKQRTPSASACSNASWSINTSHTPAANHCLAGDDRHAWQVRS